MCSSDLIPIITLSLGCIIACKLELVFPLELHGDGAQLRSVLSHGRGDPEHDAYEGATSGDPAGYEPKQCVCFH